MKPRLTSVKVIEIEIKSDVEIETVIKISVQTKNPTKSIIGNKDCFYMTP